MDGELSKREREAAEIGKAIDEIAQGMTRRTRGTMRKLKAIPKFKSEDEEREFWRTHDTTDYINWSDAKIPVMRRKGIPKVGDLAIYWSSDEEEERAGNVIEIAGAGEDTVLTVENAEGGEQELVSSSELIHFLPSRVH